MQIPLPEKDVSPIIKTGGQKALSWLRLGLVISLAAVPALIVVLNRWVGLLPLDTFQGYYIDETQPYAWLEWPAYVGLGCILALLVVLAFQRREQDFFVEVPLVVAESPPVSARQALLGTKFLIAAAWGLGLVILFSLLNRQYPGWDLALVWLAGMIGLYLRTRPVKAWLAAWKEQGDFWLALFLAHISIVAALAGYYGQQRQYFLATLVLLAAALLNLWRYRLRIPAIFWVISLALVLYAVDINSWWFSVVGDEYNFHELAQRLVEKTGFFELGRLLFRVDGVYGTHPFFSSFVQAIPMFFLGHDNFAWRFGSLYLVALGVGLFYSFARTFLEQRTALLAACLLAVSHYVMSFGKIGYNNLQALFALELVLAVAAWALRARHVLSYAALGSVLALCFYLFPGALYAVPIPLLLLGLYAPPTSSQALKRWLALLGASLVLLYPILLQPIFWQRKVPGTFLNRPELAQSLAEFLKHILTNLAYAALSFVYIPADSHFVTASYVDPLSAVLVLIGLGVFIFQFWRQRFTLFLALAYGMLLLLVGASHDYVTPPTTRMFMLLPWFALFAVGGLRWLGNQLRQAGMSRLALGFLLPLSLLAITGLNLYQAYGLFYQRLSGSDRFEAFFIRISQTVYAAEPQIPKNYVIVVDDSRGIEGLLKLQTVYPHLAWTQLYELHLTAPVLPSDSLPLLAERNTIVLLIPNLAPDWQRTLDLRLREAGKEACPVFTLDGRKYFMLYHDITLPQACLSAELKGQN